MSGPELLQNEFIGLMLRTSDRTMISLPRLAWKNKKKKKKIRIARSEGAHPL